MRLLTVVALVAAVAGGGCKKKAAPASAAAPAPAPPVDDRNTAPRSDGSVIGNAYRAGKRAASQHDMSQLGVWIESMYVESGRMPDARAITTSLQTGAANLHKLVTEGAVILTGTADHGGLWAYEVDADKAGGIVLVGGTANRATADEVKQYLARK